MLRRVNHLRGSVMNRSPVVDLGGVSGALYRGAGYLLRRPAVARLLGGRTPVSDHVRSRYAGHFDGSNRRLAALVAHPIDLAGYPGMEPAAPRAG